MERESKNQAGQQAQTAPEGRLTPAEQADKAQARQAAADQRRLEEARRALENGWPLSPAQKALLEDASRVTTKSARETDEGGPDAFGNTWIMTGDEGGPGGSHGSSRVES